MGLLDQIVGGLLAGQGSQAAAPAAGPGSLDLMQLLTALLAGGAQGGMAQGGGLGGLGALLEQFRAAGLGEQADSWVSSGPNLPVSAEQLQGVFGQDRMGQLAERMGLSTGDLGAQLAQMLPQAVDRATPQGRLPEGGLGDLGSILGGLLAR
ncbi:MAG: DUF937 domain-containing protein [Burkholderiales bacterium]|nr:DUF937 domain-containing protein [Burkholderiales bacterium]